jgi:hypothetical protein
MTDNINTHEEQTESQEHVEAMIQKGEELEARNNPNQEERPDWLPEKFKNVEQMAEAYSHLEKKLGSGESEEAPTEEAPQEQAPEVSAEVNDVKDAVENAGLNFDSLQSEYDENGKLSEDAYNKLSEAGFPQDLVNSWIAGQEALAKDYQTSVYNIVGGEQAYSDMVGWAGDNLSDNEIAAFDRAVSSGDIDMVKLAVSGLQTKYQAAEGTDPSLIEGQSSNSSGGVYSSWSEVTSAMRDPRYKSDPAYRQSVTNKLARSNVQ